MSYNGRNRGKSLVIGISDYQSLPRLGFCLNDGDEMGVLLQSLGYNISQENKLVGKVDFLTMRASIMKFFTDDNIRPEDLLFFYFSGHGLIGETGRNYLATSEIDPGRPFENGFSFDELKDMVNLSISNRIIIVLDCCYSGAIKNSKASPEDAANQGRKAIDDSIAGQVKDKVCVLASSQPGIIWFQKFGS